MIDIRRVDAACIPLYAQVSLSFTCASILEPDLLGGGLGGVLMREIPVEPYFRDLNIYDPPDTWVGKFDMTHWAFFMAFDEEKPVGGATVASRTPSVDMLRGRNDISLLWDIRVDSPYKRQGIGQRLFEEAAHWSRTEGLCQMQIETQNNNVAACRFYAKQGATLGSFDRSAYHGDPHAKPHEFQLIWYLDLIKETKRIE